MLWEHARQVLARIFIHNALFMTGFTTSGLPIACHHSVAEPLMQQSLTIFSPEQQPPTVKQAVQGATQRPRQQLLHQVVDNGTSGHHIWHQACVAQLGASDWGGVMLLQPFLHGGSLIGAPISGYHWISHPALQHMHSVVGQLERQLHDVDAIFTGRTLWPTCVSMLCSNQQ